MDINKLYMWVSLLLRYGVEENAEASSSMSKAYYFPPFFPELTSSHALCYMFQFHLAKINKDERKHSMIT